MHIIFLSFISIISIAKFHLEKKSHVFQWKRCNYSCKDLLFSVIGGHVM
jgi:hypothetical protein